MDNFENLTDAELDDLVSKKLSMRVPENASTDSYENLTDEELDKMVLEKIGQGNQFQETPEVIQEIPKGLSPRDMAEFGIKPEAQFKNGSTQAFIEGAGNELSLGYLPQIQAGVEKIYNRDQSYVELRDENIARQKMLKEQFPEDTMAGSITGSLVSAPVIGSAGKVFGLGKAINTGSKARDLALRSRDAVAIGSAYGAARNPGDTNEEVDLLQLGDRAENAVVGGLTGLATQGVMEGGSAIVNTVANSAKNLSQIAKKSAFVSLGAGKREVKKLLGTGAPEEIGETLLKEGIVTPGASVEKMLPGIQKVKQDTGKNLGSLIKEASDFADDPAISAKLSFEQKSSLQKTVPDGANIARVARHVIKTKYKNNLDTSQAKPRVEAILENIEARGKNVTIEDLHEMKVDLDGIIDWSKSAREAPVIQEQIREVRKLVNNAIQDRVDAVGRATGKPELLRALRLENKKYGQMATAERMTRDKVAANEVNRFFSLTDYIAGGAIGVASGPVGAVQNGIVSIIGATLNKGARKYGMTTIASVADKIGRKMQTPANMARFGQPLIEAAKNSPAELSALINQLSSDPEFKALIRKSNQETYNLNRGLANGKN